mmetsp:Transcript_23547/g.27115  ORF Transcript_23547/g.27115 Transcript_23547/m.27115 type:complete len:99 (-) Transcript_23547:5-301(-)
MLKQPHVQHRLVQQRKTNQTATPVSTAFNEHSTESKIQYKLLAQHKNKHRKHHQPNPRSQPQFHASSKPYNAAPKPIPKTSSIASQEHKTSSVSTILS